MRLPLLLLLAVALSAVEEGPFKVLKVIDGDTIEVQREGKPERVRLLYVDTPESGDNDHGKAMEAGRRAKDGLAEILKPGASAKLWAPGDRLDRDRYGRILAIVTADVVSPSGTAPASANLNALIVSLGWSPYWRKYGEASQPHHSVLLSSQREAERFAMGAWATAPDWMRDKANERTAPKAD